MSKSKEYELAIKIAGEVEKSFYDSTKLTKKELSNIAKQAVLTATAASDTSVSLGQRFQKGLKDAEPAFKGLENVAETTFKAMAAAAATASAAISAGLVMSVNAGSEFESAFAGVKKTVTASDAELNQMRDDIRQMAKEMPSTAAELSEIAESAGQLGIANENIIGFTKTMANMEVATNLTRDEAASDFAKFANITGMSQENFDRLGSSVVALGNNMATTEADIVSMGMRIAGAGNQVHLSQNEIMGYSAALSSVGIEAEAGGSAFSKLLVNMQMAAETGKNLSKYAKVAGMTGNEFKKAFGEDASGAINAFLAGLNDTERNGKSAIAVLTDMGLTEVRLRDTLLRAANASDLFDDALKISNDAWEENTALANEAAQRYITFESQCDILKNKVTDIGISIYDDLRPGLTEGIGLANEFVDSLAGQEDVLGNVINSAVKSMPTMVRHVKEAGEAVGEFAQPFLAVGGWLVENPGLITGTIAGIGTSLATYKVASGVMSLVTSLGALGPVGWTIMGIGGAAAVITGIGTAVKKSAAEAKKANLDKHFGNITLSMKELQQTASFIVKNKCLEQIQESISAIGELDGISDAINSAAEDLNKMNWKVSMGMELTDQEKENYQNQLEAYMQSTQDYITQRQYAVNLSVTTLLGDDMENSNVVAQLNAFYADKQQELADLGTQLNDAITDAFNDGLLEPEEAEIIANLQAQMAHIKSVLAGSDFEAGLDLIGVKYSGQPLDADSFQNLQSEIQDQVSEAMMAYDEAYRTSVSEYRTLLSEGRISQEDFDSELETLNAGYLQQQMDIQARAAEFQLNTIQQAYGDEMSALIEQLQSETNIQLEEMLDSVAYHGALGIHLDLLGEDILDSIDIDKSTKDALADLFEQMQPSMEQMEGLAQQYREAGMDIPEELRKGISDMGAIGALAGDTDAIWEVIGQAAESEEYHEAIATIWEAGGYIPEQIARAVTDGQEDINDAVYQSYLDTQEEYNKTFGKGIDVTIPINFAGTVIQNAQKGIEASVKTGHADGGIFNTPHIAWFAEDGPEAVIPINNSRNAIDLWEKTGELLGMEGLEEKSSSLDSMIENNTSYDNSSQNTPIIYNPTFQFYGSAPSKQDLEEVMETEQEKFARMMEEYLKDNRRTKFA